MHDQFLKDDRRTEAGGKATVNDALLARVGDDDVIQQLLSAVVVQSGSGQGWMAVYEPRSKQLVIRASVGLPGDALEQFARLRSTHTGPGPAFSLRKPVLIEDIETDREYAMYLATARRAGVRAVISTPFFTATGEPLGILCLCFQHARTFSDADIRLAQLGAQQLAIFSRTCHALAESRQRLERMTTDLPVVSWSVNAQGRVICRQPGWEKFSGMEFDAYRDYRWQTAVHPGDWRRIENQCLEALSAGTSFQVDCRLRRADGAYRSMRIQGSAWKGAGGEILEWTGYSEDRTAILQLEEQLASAKSRTTRVLSILAHDLRNPLSTLSLAARVIQHPGTLPTQFAHFGRIIERQTRKMAQVVEDLLAVTRVARGRLVLDQKPVAMRSVVESATELVHPFVKERRHSLSVRFPRDPLHVFGDKSRLVQALSTLISHAARTMTGSGQLAVTLSEGAGNVFLVVEHDRGGIHPATLPTLFELAGDSDRPEETAGEDLNLGLALVKSIASYHGGSVDACNKENGAGTVFTVSLPRMEEDA